MDDLSLLICCTQVFILQEKLEMKEYEIEKVKDELRRARELLIQQEAEMEEPAPEEDASVVVDEIIDDQEAENISIDDQEEATDARSDDQEAPVEIEMEPETET